MMAFRLVNGLPRMVTLRRAFGNMPATRPGPNGMRLQYRLHATLRGARLRVTIPWTPLVNVPIRPNWYQYLRVGAAVIMRTAHHGGALEWGGGLISRVDPHLWPLLKYAVRK